MDLTSVNKLTMNDHDVNGKKLENDTNLKTKNSLCFGNYNFWNRTAEIAL